MQLQSVINYGQSFNLYDRLTIVIPVRIECKERMNNLRTVLSHIRLLGCRTIVLEADKESLLRKETWLEGFEHLFVHDYNPVFHRTKYINKLLNMATTEMVAIWDTDVVVDLHQVKIGTEMIDKGSTIVYPYNGEFVMLTEQPSANLRERCNIEELANKKPSPIFGRPFCGGIYMVHRLRYLNCGGENENFTGWGPEDAERLRRVKILGHEVKWVKDGQAYHMWYPRGSNSRFYSTKDEIRLKSELVKVCSMERDELINYISSEQWNITKN